MAQPPNPKTVQNFSPKDSPVPEEADTKKIIIKTVLVTSLLFVVAIGLVILGYVLNQRQNEIKKLIGKSTTPTVKPGDVSSQPTTKPIGSDEGDENIGDDPAYIAAMNTVPEMTTYTSPFGYTIKLMKGWRNIVSMTIQNADGKTEVFSPYSDEQFKKTLNEDPYNPNYYLEVEIRENPKNVPLLQWTANSTYSPQAMGQENFDTTVGGYPAVKVIGNQGTGYYDYYISANGKIYNPGYFFTEDEQWKSPTDFSLDIFETMIDSFVPTK
jgi:hypothetical protein